MKVSILEFSCRFDYNHFGYYYLVQRKKNIDFPGSNHCFPCKKCHFLGFPSILAQKCSFPGFCGNRDIYDGCALRSVARVSMSLLFSQTTGRRWIESFLYWELNLIAFQNEMNCDLTCLSASENGIHCLPLLNQKFLFVDSNDDITKISLKLSMGQYILHTASTVLWKIDMSK